MATKFGRVVTCSGGPHLQSHVSFWLRGHVTNLKNLYLLLCNTYGHQTWQSSSLRSGTSPSKSCDLLIMWSRDKCKNLYLHFCNIYGHQNWQSSNLRWGDHIFKVTWTLDYVVTWQMEKTYISKPTQYLWLPNLAEW